MALASTGTIVHANGETDIDYSGHANPKGSKMDNLAIWQKVETTDPKYTKPITGRGYNGTSTNATYLVKKATSVFGPCGIGWGVTVLNEGLLEGADGSKVHRVHIRLWYMLDGKRGEVEHFGQTDFCGKRKSGQWFTDEEAPKKSMTDAMLKALSMIGFAADIHLGQYDDNKYVATLKREGVDEPWQTTNDDDATASSKTEDDFLTDDQSEAITALLTETKANITAFLQTFRVESVSDLRKSQYADAHGALLRKKAKMGAAS